MLNMTKRNILRYFFSNNIGAISDLSNISYAKTDQHLEKRFAG